VIAGMYHVRAEPKLCCPWMKELSQVSLHEAGAYIASQ